MSTCATLRDIYSHGSVCSTVISILYDWLFFVAFVLLQQHEGDFGTYMYHKNVKLDQQQHLRFESKDPRQAPESEGGARHD